MSELEATIMQALKGNAEPVTQGDLARATDEPYNAIGFALNGLVRRLMVRRHHNGDGVLRYSLLKEPKARGTSNTGGAAHRVSRPLSTPRPSPKADQILSLFSADRPRLSAKEIAGLLPGQFSIKQIGNLLQMLRLRGLVASPGLGRVDNPQWELVGASGDSDVAAVHAAVPSEAAAPQPTEGPTDIEPPLHARQGSFCDRVLGVLRMDEGIKARDLAAHLGEGVSLTRVQQALQYLRLTHRAASRGGGRGCYWWLAPPAPPAPPAEMAPREPAADVATVTIDASTEERLRAMVALAQRYTASALVLATEVTRTPAMPKLAAANSLLIDAGTEIYTGAIA